jgi:hypothetical protein
MEKDPCFYHPLPSPHPPGEREQTGAFALREMPYWAYYVFKVCGRYVF